MTTELQLIERIGQLEAKVDFLLKKLGWEEEAKQARPDVSQIEDLIRRGDTMGAIKLYVAKTGANLNTANEAVKKMQQDLKK